MLEATRAEDFKEFNRSAAVSDNKLKKNSVAICEPIV
jgi:hypothetical protein